MIRHYGVLERVLKLKLPQPSRKRAWISVTSQNILFTLPPGGMRGTSGEGFICLFCWLLEPSRSGEPAAGKTGMLRFVNKHCGWAGR